MRSYTNAEAWVVLKQHRLKYILCGREAAAVIIIDRIGIFGAEAIGVDSGDKNI